jgi:hypothetical protein
MVVSSPGNHSKLGGSAFDHLDGVFDEPDRAFRRRVGLGGVSGEVIR